MTHNEVYANMPAFFERQITEPSIDALAAAEHVRFSYKHSVGTIRPET